MRMPLKPLTTFVHKVLPVRYLKPANYVRRLRRLWYLARYDPEKMRQVEDAKFAEAGVDREDALKVLSQHLPALGVEDYNSGENMSSVHWLLFAALSRKQGFRRILEIGTFDGQTTALLSRLFPKAEIVTVDLPPSDPILAGTYSRDTPSAIESYERRLAVNTAAANIRVLRVNGFFLPSAIEGTFDLIWVDGGHLYPEVAWDLCNGWNHLNSGGVLMCDDVISHPRGTRDAYVSPDSSSVLNYITVRTGDRCWYFLKRESPEWSADPRARKFVAMLVKERPTIPLGT